MSEEKENNQDTGLTATRENTGKRVDPILEHLVVENSEFDKKIIRERFIDIWEYENGDTLSEEEQFMTREKVPKMSSTEFKTTKIESPIGRKWTKRSPQWARRPFEAPRWAQEAQRSAKNATKVAADGPKSCVRGPKREPKERQRCPKESPKDKKK